MLYDCVNILCEIMLTTNVVDPDNKVHVAHMGTTWVLSAPGGTHVGPMHHQGRYVREVT